MSDESEDSPSFWDKWFAFRFDWVVDEVIERPDFSTIASGYSAEALDALLHIFQTRTRGHTEARIGRFWIILGCISAAVLVYLIYGTIGASLDFFGLVVNWNGPWPYCDTTAGRTTGIIYLLVIAFAFYLLRLWFRVLYGFIEFGIACLVCNVTLSQVALTGFGAWAGIAAAIYLVVRAFANIHEGLEELRPKEEK